MDNNHAGNVGDAVGPWPMDTDDEPGGSDDETSISDDDEPGGSDDETSPADPLDNHPARFECLNCKRKRRFPLMCQQCHSSYCHTNCLHAHWVTHKPECRDIANRRKADTAPFIGPTIPYTGPLGAASAGGGTVGLDVDPPKKIGLIDVLHIICDCGFGRETIQACSTNRALRDDPLHLVQIVNIEYGDRCERGTRVGFCLRHPDTDDSIAAARLGSLLRAGGRVNPVVERGCSALLYASQYNLHGCLAQLLQQPSLDINVQEAYGPDAATALCLAAKDGNLNLAACLLARGADVNLGMPLIWAIDRNRVAMVDLLLGAPDIRINQCRKDGETPIHHAIMDDIDPEILRMLLQQPTVSVNKRDFNGNTCLLLAARFGFADKLRLLLGREDVLVNNGDQDGQTPLIACAKSGHAECAELLLVHPQIAADQADTYGWTPLTFACFNGHFEVVQTLLVHPAIQVMSS